MAPHRLTTPKRRGAEAENPWLCGSDVFSLQSLVVLSNVTSPLAQQLGSSPPEAISSTHLAAVPHPRPLLGSRLC